MSTRATAKQGVSVKLIATFKKNGILTDPDDAGTITIINPSAVVQVSGQTVTRESVGTYYYNYSIITSAPIGTWTDRWVGVIYDAGQTAVNVDLNFYVHEADWVPIASDVCRVYDFIYNIDGTPLIGTTGTAEIISLPYEYSDIYYSNASGGTATSDSSGKIYWDVVYGATVLFEVKQIELQKTVVIPSVTTKELSTITEVT